METAHVIAAVSTSVETAANAGREFPGPRYAVIYRQREEYIAVEGRRRYGGSLYREQRRRLELEAEELFLIPPIREVSCPLCGGAVYDRRGFKLTEPEADYRCRTGSCRGEILPDSFSGD